MSFIWRLWATISTSTIYLLTKKDEWKYIYIGTNRHTTLQLSSFTSPYPLVQICSLYWCWTINKWTPTWTFLFFCRPFHALSIGEASNITVTLNTHLTATTPHTGGRGAVLTRGMHVARWITWFTGIVVGHWIT